MLGQDVGFPVPQGGAGELAEALAARACAGGGDVRDRRPVASTSRSAAAGRSASGRGSGSLVRARRAVLADVPRPRSTATSSALRAPAAPVAPRPRPVPVGPPDHQGQLGARPTRAVDGAEGARGAGTVHLGVDHDGLRRHGRRPVRRPDPRAPVPAVRADDHVRPDPLTGGHRVGVGVHARPARATTGRGELLAEHVDRHARRPSSGWRPASGDLVLARHVQSPATSRRADAEPRRRRHQRRDVRPPPAALPPADAGAGSSRDADRRPLPGERVGPPRRRRARCLRLERRPSRPHRGGPSRRRAARPHAYRVGPAHPADVTTHRQPELTCVGDVSRLRGPGLAILPRTGVRHVRPARHCCLRLIDRLTAGSGRRLGNPSGTVPRIVPQANGVITLTG